MGRQIQQYMKFTEAYKMKVKLDVEDTYSALDHVKQPKALWTSRNDACNKHHCFLLFYFQEEQYDHLDEADVTKVEKLTNDAMIWMNNAMGQQSKQSLSVDPTVKVKDIQAKMRVSDCLSK